jgi:excisionase family DNA binding protein
MTALPETPDRTRPTARLLAIGDVAAQLSLSKDSVRRLITSGRLFSVKSGNRRLIPDTAVDTYIATLIREAEL